MRRGRVDGGLNTRCRGDRRCRCLGTRLHTSKHQLKKKKQAAKRKSVASEYVELEGDVGAQVAGDGETTKKSTAAPLNQDDGALEVDSPPGEITTAGAAARDVGGDRGSEVLVDEEMSDASRPVEATFASSDAGVGAITDVDTVQRAAASMAAVIPPIPPEIAAPNGKSAASGTKQHKKSVSFVMSGGDAASVLCDISDGRIGGKMLPPLPPLRQDTNSANRVGQEERGDGTGANGAFLRRNFKFGENSDQVRSCVGVAKFEDPLRM